MTKPHSEDFNEFPHLFFSYVQFVYENRDRSKSRRTRGHMLFFLPWQHNKIVYNIGTSVTTRGKVLLRRYWNFPALTGLRRIFNTRKSCMMFSFFHIYLFVPWRVESSIRKDVVRVVLQFSHLCAADGFRRRHVCNSSYNSAEAISPVGFPYSIDDVPLDFSCIAKWKMYYIHTRMNRMIFARNSVNLLHGWWGVTWIPNCLAFRMKSL